MEDNLNQLTHQCIKWLVGEQGRRLGSQKGGWNPGLSILNFWSRHSQRGESRKPARKAVWVSGTVLLVCFISSAQALERGGINRKTGSFWCSCFVSFGSVVQFQE